MMINLYLRRACMMLLVLFPGLALVANAADSKRDIAVALSSQNAQVYRVDDVQTSVAIKTGRLDAQPVMRAWVPGDPIRFVPKRVYPLPGLGDPVNPTSWTVDSLLKIQAEAQGATRGGGFTTPTVNVPGQLFSGAFPPDTVGDVGPTRYVQAINAAGGSGIAIYNKSGGLVAGPFTLTGLGGTGLCGTGAGDPIILYDRAADRWMLSEFSGIGNALCVYISQTADAGGAYFAYTFPTTNFPDYPKYGVWPDAYYVSTNEGGPSPVYAMNRTAMLAGAAGTMQRFTAPSLGGFGFQALTPADVDGATPPPGGAPGYYIRHRDDEVHNPGANNPNQDFLEIWELDIDFAVPGNSSFTGPTNIPISEFDSELCGLVSFNCFQQPNGQRLDPLREVVMWRAQYRNFGSHQTLVGNLTTDVNGADRGGLRWFELRNTGGGWSLFQEGTYSPDTDNRWMGSAAMDQQGNIAIGYSVVSTTQPTDIRYTGRLAGDAAGALTQAETTIGAGNGSQNAERWGDYSSMNVDPADDCTFWYTTEYVTQNNRWDTRIAAFKFPGCGGPGPVCGDGMIDAPESCDDGGTNNGDGCSALCQVEPGFTCVGEPSVCTPDQSDTCLAENFNGPTNWTVFNVGAIDVNWGLSNDGVCWSGNLGGPPAPNVTGGDGVAACIDSDAAGNGIVAALLCSPQFNAGNGNITLDFLYNYQIFQAPDANDVFDVLVGTAPPGPATIGAYAEPFFTQVNEGTFDGLPGASESVDLTGFAGQDIHVCFGYVADFDWYAQVDDVTVTASGGCGGQVNNPPVLAPIGDQEFLIPSMFSIPLSASDPDGDELTFTANIPFFCQLNDGGPGDNTATIDCNPNQGQASVTSVMVTVTDDGAPPMNDTEIFSLVLELDIDGDGIRDIEDNCINVPNPDQRDGDVDGFGVVCDGDFNNNCVVNAVDLGIFRTLFFGNSAAADFNGDGVVNAIDLGFFKTLFFTTPGPSGLVPDQCN